MPIRQAEATWEGGLKRGNGSVALGSGAFEGPYSFASRFEDGEGTNPEELLGAAHSGCFSLQLAASLERADYDPERVHTKADVHLKKGDDGWSITCIELTTEASVPGIDDEAFQEYARDAKENCIVSRALAGVDIELDARLTP